MHSNEELLKQISELSPAPSSISLSEIQYDRKRLEKNIKYVPFPDEYLKQTIEYLNTIDKEVEETKLFKAKKYLVIFTKESEENALNFTRVSILMDLGDNQ